MSATGQSERPSSLKKVNIFMCRLCYICLDYVYRTTCFTGMQCWQHQWKRREKKRAKSIQAKSSHFLMKAKLLSAVHGMTIRKEGQTVQANFISFMVSSQKIWGRKHIMAFFHYVNIYSLTVWADASAQNTLPTPRDTLSIKTRPWNSENQRKLIVDVNCEATHCRPL